MAGEDEARGGAKRKAAAKKAATKKAATKKAATKKAKRAAPKPPATAKVEEELSRCIIQLLLKEPFFGHLLAGVVRQIGEQTPTAGVGVWRGQVRLFINPTFFLKTTRKRPERVAVVKHETLHLLFKHVLRAKDGDRRDPRLWNLAADLVVNQLIGSPWKLPESAITLKVFPDLGLEPDQTADVYYARLAALDDEMRRATGRGEGSGESGPGGAGGAGAGASGAGSAGGGKPGEAQREATERPRAPYSGASAEEWAERGVSAPESAEALSRAAEVWHSDHGQWGRGEDEVGEDAARSVLDGLIARTADRVGPKGWGDLPGPLRDLVQAALDRRQPQVDWRRVVRMFSNSARRTRISSTLRRPSQRYGTYPGIKVKRLQRLAVAVDTSGSISDDELSAFFAEVHGMWRQGAEVHVLECDAAVQRSYPYRGELPKVVGGRGGTRFDPVFEALRADRMQIWDGCIYLTDGYAPAPEVRPPCKLLWVLTAGGREGDHLPWGRVVRLRR